MSRYEAFAQVEYDYVREHVYPAFEWRAFEAASPRNSPAGPLDQLRVALVATAGAYRSGQSSFKLGRSGDASSALLVVG